MRLTLRTLLAYMEDRLPPANAREIGQKIARSPFSTELMERIRDVLRKRRLAASTHTQFTIDPNLIAEYLDDQLTPELVARIERELLSSDVALAEIAACYQIVASMHEAQPLENHLKQRLYDLDPSGAMEVVHKLADAKQENNETPAEVSRAPAEWKPLDARVMTGRRLPAIIVTVMAFVWLVVVATDPVLFREDATDGTPPAIAQQVPEPAGQDDQPDDDEIQLADNNAGVPEDVETGTPSDDRQPDETPDPPTSETETGDAEPAVANNDPAPTDTDAADAGPDKTPDANVMENNTTEEPPVVAVDPEVEQWVPVRMLDRFQSTMMLDPTTGTWTIAQPGGAVGPMDAEARNTFDWSDTIRDRWLAIPPAFESTFSVDGSGWTARTLGPALIQINSSPGGSGFSMLSGRALVETTAVPGMADDAARRLILGQDAGSQRITLMTPDTVLGV